MYLKAIFFNFHAYLSLLIVIVETLGDYLVEISEVHLVKALYDNATHSVVGALCWLQFSLHSVRVSKAQILLETLICAVVSSLIDLDHFYAARSLYLKDATNLSQRPPLHCTTIPLSIFMLLLVLSYGLKMSILKKVALIIFVAFISHHTRDATRRGYWLYPFGSTPPVPYGMYLFLTVLVPYVALFFDIQCKSGSESEYSLVKTTVIEI